MDVYDLKFVDCGYFTALSDQYRATSAMARQAADEVELKISARMRLSLNGQASDAAQGQLTALARNFRYIEAETGTVGASLAAYAAEMGRYQAILAPLTDWADANDVEYGADGEVWFPDTRGHRRHLRPQSGADPEKPVVPRDGDDPMRAPSQELSNRLGELKEKASQLDDEWSVQPEQLQADDDLTVSAADWRDSRADTAAVRSDLQGLHVTPPPAHGTPSQNAAWWKSLGPRTQAMYRSAYASELAARDGLPDDVSAEAGRIDYEQHA